MSANNLVQRLDKRTAKALRRAITLHEDWARDAHRLDGAMTDRAKKAIARRRQKLVAHLKTSGLARIGIVSNGSLTILFDGLTVSIALNEPMLRDLFPDSNP